MEERYEIAIDRTVKAHEDPPEKPAEPVYLEGEGAAFERYEEPEVELENPANFTVLLPIPPEVSVDWTKDYKKYEPLNTTEV